jgi:hypothetical protein
VRSKNTEIESVRMEVDSLLAAAAHAAKKKAQQQQQRG